MSKPRVRHLANVTLDPEKLVSFGISPPVSRPADRPYAETRATDPDGNNFDLSVHSFQQVETAGDREKGNLEKV